MTTTYARPESRDVAIALIDAPELPSRSEMDDSKLDELTESIRAVGLIQPIGLAPVGDRYKVIYGHRRRIACERAGLPIVPCRVYPSDNVPTWLMQAHENSKREDLNPADEAEWFALLLEKECGNDIEKLCGLVGENLSYVDGRLELLRGHREIFDALRAGEIKIGVARELNKIPEHKYALYYLNNALKNGATVAVATGYVAEYKRVFGNPLPPQAAAPPAETAPSSQAFNPTMCFCCRGSEDAHEIQYVPVHSYCFKAIVVKALETYLAKQ